MRRATIVLLRAMIVLFLLAGAADVPIPGRSRDRVRIHLVDRSASVGVEGPRDSLLPRDADDIVARDVATRRTGDTVTWASFGRSVAFESRTVDPSATDLAGALTTALGRNPTEIVLYTDGRGDPGNALFLCRERGVPVHVFPLGPTSVKDVRIRRIAAPPAARPGQKFPIEVTVESTFDTDAAVRLNGRSRTVKLAAGVPASVVFPDCVAGDFQIDLDDVDACPENNHVRGHVLEGTERLKVLALSRNFPDLSYADVTKAERLPDLGPFDAVIVHDITPTGPEQEALAAWVDQGGGLILSGGLRSFALGGWQRTPLESLSPLKIHPDLKVAVVFGIDSSGSMKDDFHSTAQVVLDAREAFDADDDVAAMTFGDQAKMVEFDQLRKQQPTGGTSLINGIATAARHLEARSAGRKVIVLITDGETKESFEDIRGAIARLNGIALYVVTTRVEVPGATNLRIGDWAGLQAALRGVTAKIQDLSRVDPGRMDVRPHPITSGVNPVALPWINRTTAKPDAQVLATVGRPPTLDPVVAVRPFGRGRVVALAFPWNLQLDVLYRHAVEYAAGDSESGLSLSIDPPVVHAVGACKDARFETDGVKVTMDQVGSQTWEGRLPEGLSGTVFVKKGRARAAATIPCPPEFEALGVDRAALERIARETGGRVLALPGDLDSLPRPERSEPRGGRIPFLIAALILVFAEMAASTFWKAR